MLERAVVEAGFDAATAGSAEQATKLFETLPAPQIVLLDLNLPGVDGMEFLHRLLDERAGATCRSSS